MEPPGCQPSRDPADGIKGLTAPAPKRTAAIGLRGDACAVPPGAPGLRGAGPMAILRPPRRLSSLAVRGEEAAAATIAEAAGLFALTLLSVRAVVDLSDFVLGGGIGSQPIMRDAIEQALPGHGVTDIRLRTSTLGSQAGILGAAPMARQSLADRMSGFSDAGDAPPAFIRSPLDSSPSTEVRP